MRNDGARLSRTTVLVQKSPPLVGARPVRISLLIADETHVARDQFSRSIARHRLTFESVTIRTRPAAEQVWMEAVRRRHLPVQYQGYHSS